MESGRFIPPHEEIRFPEDLDPDTLIFVLEHLAHIAMEYGLDAMQTTIEPSSPDSIDEFVHQLEDLIAHSDRESRDKDAALNVIKELVVFYRRALEHARNT